jgi:Restriction endonuclease
MQLRHDQGRLEEDGPKWWHAADVSQSWKVDSFRPIPVPRIPAWIRRSLFGRSTYGVVRSQEGIDENPHATMIAVLESEGFNRREWSLDSAVVERRLMEDLTPTTFEHLVVSLLQLEHPSETWVQVGGSGDGGVDGVGADQEGNVAGLLQCKWQYWGGDPFADTVWKAGSASFRTYLASLLCPADIARPANIAFLGRADISKLVIKHHMRLPQAVGMRIGVG